MLGGVWPEPASSAAGSRMLQLLAPMRERGWEITYAATAAPSAYSADLASMGIETLEVRANDSTFDVVLKALAPDMVLFDRFYLEEQFGWRVAEHCPAAIRVLDGEDLHCLRKSRQRARGQGVPFALDDLPGSRVARREVASILRSDLTLVISEFEQRVLEEVLSVPREQLQYTPFMVDPPTPAERASLPRHSERNGFLSIGNFRHAPNADAVRWLKERVWPRIRGAMPRAELTVAGAYPTSEVLAAHDPGTGFRVVGRVEDVDVEMRQARICLAPLRFGAGLKGKLMDAMRNGTPSVTTSIGVEGLAGDLAWGGAVADDEEALVAAALRLHEDEAAWQRAQRQGFEILEGRFDRATHEAAWCLAVDETRTHRDARRHRNFLGAMLLEHRQQAAKYMSRWIETKNQLSARDDQGASGRRPAD